MRAASASIAAALCFYTLLWAGALWADTTMAASSTFHMDMVYKYSEQFRTLMQARNMEHLVSHWPRLGTVEYYQKLVQLDSHRHASRNLATTTSGGSYSLSPTNQTILFEGLHFSFITLGTPGQQFLVSLDTGSDLLWVPCECEQCSPTNWAAYGINSTGLNFSVYSPLGSTTSQSVLCSDAICTATLSPGNCTSASKTCSYVMTYVSANTSSSGTIVQDVVHLDSESANGGKITAPIYFGCGKVQTGDFLNGGAPNGLLGLGPDVYSLPTTLAKKSIVPNVFSMCFSLGDKSGRLVFGKKGDPSFQQTPLIPINPSEFYVVEATKFVVGNVSIKVSETLVFDTGTSITRLPSALVKVVGDAFSQQTTLKTFEFLYQDGNVFNYCWNISSDNDLKSFSNLSMTFSGGSTWDVQSPFLGFLDGSGNLQFICLGILEDSITIIGFNFMGGYEYFFDQESMLLSWAPSDCYSSNTSASQAPQESPSGSIPSPSPNLSPKSSPNMSPKSSPNLSPKLPTSPSILGSPPNQQSQGNKASKSLESLSFQLLLLFVLFACSTLLIAS